MCLNNHDLSLSSCMTIVSSNDIVILTLTPIICNVASQAECDPTPLLFAQFYAANVWSILLVIGNPTNIIVAEANNISFLQYTSKYQDILCSPPDANQDGWAFLHLLEASHASWFYIFISGSRFLLLLRSERRGSQGQPSKTYLEQYLASNIGLEDSCMQLQPGWPCV